MKTLTTILTCLLFLVSGIMLAQSKPDAPSSNGSSGKIEVACTPDLLPLAKTWVQEYGNQHPGVKIHLSWVSPSITPDAGYQVCLSSDQYITGIDRNNAYQLVVAREIIVPVINKNNPLLGIIRAQGISEKELLTGIAENGHASWKDMLEGAESLPVHFYMAEDGLTVAKVAAFLKTGKNDLRNFTMVAAGKFSETISGDPNALGFCRLSEALDPKAEKLNGNLLIMPVDKNGNGKLEFMENIYDNLTEFNRGVWIGKYPRSLTDHVFLSMVPQPANSTTADFVQWILTTGQAQLPALGYSELTEAERNTQTDKVLLNPVEIAKTETSESLTKMIVMLVAGILILGIVAVYLFRKLISGVAGVSASGRNIMPGLDEAHVEIPGGLFFDKTHTWAFMEKNGLVKVGIDDFLQHITGRITRIELKKNGDFIRKGEVLCTIIQDGKQLNLYAPVSGAIRVANPALSENSSLINQSPYFGGWIYQVEPTNWLREIRLLFMAHKYREWLAGEFTRVKDFISMYSLHPGISMVALQDGGLLQDHILEEMGPETWEEFQHNFLDSAK